MPLHRVLIKKCLVEARLLFAACCATLLAFCWLRVYIVSRVEMSTFATIVEELWDKWSDFAPVPLSQLLSYSGRMAITFDEPVVVLCVAIFAIARGSDCVSGELNRGTMEMLLAQPVSRLQVLCSQGLVTLTCLALLCLAVWGGMYGGIQTFQVKEEAPAAPLRVPGLGIQIPNPFGKPQTVTVPMRDRVQPLDFVPAAVNLFSLGVCLAGVATFFSASDRYRWRTVGLTVGFYIVELICKIAALALEDFRWLKGLTIFSAYEPQKFVSIAVHEPASAWALLMRDSAGHATLGPLGCDLTLIGIGLAGYAAAAFVFTRRDLPAPL